MYVEPCPAAMARGGELCPESTWSNRSVTENNSEDKQIFLTNMRRPCPICLRIVKRTLLPGMKLMEQLENARIRKENGLREAFVDWPAIYKRLVMRKENKRETQNCRI